MNNIHVSFLRKNVAMEWLSFLFILDTEHLLWRNTIRLGQLTMCNICVCFSNRFDYVYYEGHSCFCFWDRLVTMYSMWRPLRVSCSEIGHSTNTQNCMQPPCGFWNESHFSILSLAEWWTLFLIRKFMNIHVRVYRIDL
mgnify:CR=1 FL=1